MVKKNLSIQHSLDKFGHVSGLTRSIRINRLEDRRNPLVPFPHRHAFYHMVYVTAGTGWHEIDFIRYNVRKSKLFFMSPGQVHNWELSPETTGYVVEFGNEVFFETIGKGDFFSVIQKVPNYLDLGAVVRESQDRIRHLLKSLLRDYEVQPIDFEYSLKHYLMALLIEVTRVNSQFDEKKANQTGDPFLERFLFLLEENYAKEHQVAFYARRLRVTPKALTMRMTRILDKSARKMIQDRVLLEAKRLLLYSNFTIAEVGFELNYEDPNYFTRFFKNETGLTPREFREASSKK